MFKLRELVRNKRAFDKSLGIRYRIKRVPRMQHPVALEAEYARYIKSVVEFTAGELRKELLPRLPFILRSAGSSRSDAYTDDLNEIIRTVRATVGEQFSDEQIRHAIRARGVRVADWNRKQMTRVLASALSIDVYSSAPWLAAELNGFVHTNAALIESIPRDMLREAEIRIQTGIRQGMRVEELTNIIEERYRPSTAAEKAGVVKRASNRAELIARDQVGKFNGDLNRMRQTGLGIEKYRWRTVRDERVRPFHSDLEGTVQRWDSPPVVSSDGRRAHPGEDYQCRCQAEPVLDF